MKELAFSLGPKDFEFQTFTTSGAGGQRRDKKQTGVRIIHPPSGASAVASDERSQWQNKKIALRRLVNTPKFKYWCELQIRGQVDWVEENIGVDKFLVETHKDGTWQSTKLTESEVNSMKEWLKDGKKKKNS